MCCGVDGEQEDGDSPASDSVRPDTQVSVQEPKGRLLTCFAYLVNVLFLFVLPLSVVSLLYQRVCKIKLKMWRACVCVWQVRRRWEERAR